jgi:DNA-binding NarL/FixJ family response regulator
MVEWLWSTEQPDVARQVERLFYALARTHVFSLFCTYAMASFYRQAGRGLEPSSSTSGLEGLLSPREADVLRRTARGHTNKDIANALQISVRTVEAHKANAMRKLALGERADLVRFAVAHGWLTEA